MNSIFFVNWFRRNWVLNGEMTRNTCSTQEFREGFKTLFLNFQSLGLLLKGPHILTKQLKKRST